MKIETLNQIFLVFAFVVPGFILHATLEKFGAVSPAKQEIAVLRFLCLSALNYGVCSALIYWLQTPYFLGHPVMAGIGWMFIMSISPIILGLIGARISKGGRARQWLNHLGLNPIHPIPTAWDWQFERGPFFMLVTLRDGSSVAGLFEGQSFASSDPSERDIYISHVFHVQEAGSWLPVDRSAGILIAKDQVRHIEFWNLRQEE